MTHSESRYSFEDNPTVFGRILRKELPANVVYEDADILAFTDIQPRAKVHIIVIPKQHMTCLRCATPKDADLLAKLMIKIPEIARIAGLEDSGYRVITNAGPDARQEVPHIHFHILGGEQLNTL